VGVAKFSVTFCSEILLCACLFLGKKGVFGCSTLWKSLFQCTGKLIPVSGLLYSEHILFSLKAHQKKKNYALEN
jgi:hypothetical protein